MEGYHRVVGRRIWSIFQQKPNDHALIYLLNQVFKRENHRFLNLDEQTRLIYNQVFHTEEDIINQLSPIIAEDRLTLDDSLHKWKVHPDSHFAYTLFLNMIQQFISKEWFINLHTEVFLVESLKNLELKRYKKIIINYLDSFDSSGYSDLFFNQVIERLNNPTENLSRWEDIPDEIIEKVKMRLRAKELDTFLEDGKRANYWKNYVAHMTNITYVRNSTIAAFYFGDFVVVEFSITGNAAYFYHTEGFSNNLAQKLNNRITENQMKDKDAPYFITKIDHRGYWQPIYDNHMHEFLNGNFYFGGY